MEHLIQAIARHWDFSPAQYWHWRVLSAVLVGPVLGILYLLFFSKRARARRTRRQQLHLAADAARARWGGGKRSLSS